MQCLLNQRYSHHFRCMESSVKSAYIVVRKKSLEWWWWWRVWWIAVFNSCELQFDDQFLIPCVTFFANLSCFLHFTNPWDWCRCPERYAANQTNWSSDLHLHSIKRLITLFAVYNKRRLRVRIFADALHKYITLVSALDQRFESAGCGMSRSNRGPVNCSLHPGPGHTQPSILSGSVNEYRLQLGRYKAGMCDAALCARHVPERLWGLLLGALYHVLYLYLYLYHIQSL